MLVDRQDFNAPISYTFTADRRMWYQRTPNNYVDIEWTTDTNDATKKVRTTKGWEGISLPFKAEIVTTQQKGEITHFYNSGTAEGTTGHEYWLRAFKDIDNDKSIGTKVAANFEYPASSSTDGDKGYSNTFLWDYYYSYNEYNDQNLDNYQEKDDTRTYYSQGREYKDYPRLAAATPYIIGFPGQRYYEFDLSGRFTPANTAAWPANRTLEQQTITFASKTGITINVSDDEMGGTMRESGNKQYTFKPCYLNNTTVESGNSAFLLNNDGNSYDEQSATPTTTAATVAFRPYFVAPTVSGARAAGTTRSIVFAGATDDTLKAHDTKPADRQDGTLTIGTRRHTIVVTSTLRGKRDVAITTTSGITIATFTIAPGETVETRINNAGVYIVRDDEGLYTTKLSVR
jgi:hypothetical protein